MRNIDSKRFWIYAKEFSNNNKYNNKRHQIGIATKSTDIFNSIHQLDPDFLESL